MSSVPVVFVETDTRIVVTNSRQYSLPWCYRWTQEKGISWDTYGRGRQIIKMPVHSEGDRTNKETKGAKYNLKCQCIRLELI